MGLNNSFKMKHKNKPKKQEIEAKFLILERPRDFLVGRMWELIVQTYLWTFITNATARVRKSTELVNVTYTKTVKIPTSEIGAQDEDDVIIGFWQYHFLRFFKRDLSRNVIFKTRYTYMHGIYKCEHDVFHGANEGYEMLEVEVPTIEDLKKIILPPQLKYREVTGDRGYSNSSISRKGFPTNEKVRLT
jgi:CYTH domain-containing protein